MAEVAFLHYRPGKTLLHRLPGWAKLLILLGLSAACGKGGPVLLAGMALLLTAGSLGLKPAFRRMKGALAFAFIMAGLLVASDGGQTGFGTESLIRGARFLLVFWTGILFTTAAHPAEIGGAFETLTRWIPHFHARRLNTHITLTLTFLPLILDESATVDRAARSRCFRRRRNPLVRLRYRVEPLVDGVFRKSDEISRAMAARCYGEDDK